MRVPCVGAVVHDDTGRLLLVQRRNDPDRGRWSVPGGRVEPGETGPAAVIREAREETGLDVEVERLLGSVEIPDGRPADPDRVLAVDDYACVVRGGRLRAGDDALAARWVDTAALGRLDADDLLVDGLLAALRTWDALPRR